LEEIVAAAVKKTETNDRGIRCADHATPSIRKSWHYFAKKRRSFGRHSSLADQSHGVPFMLLLFSVALIYIKLCKTSMGLDHFKVGCQINLRRIKLGFEAFYLLGYNDV
jgi:hypothetical protein